MGTIVAPNQILLTWRLRATKVGESNGKLDRRGAGRLGILVWTKSVVIMIRNRAPNNRHVDLRGSFFGI